MASTTPALDVQGVSVRAPSAPTAPPTDRPGTEGARPSDGPSRRIDAPPSMGKRSSAGSVQSSRSSRGSIAANLSEHRKRVIREQIALRAEARRQAGTALPSEVAVERGATERDSTLLMHGGARETASAGEGSADAQVDEGGDTVPQQQDDVSSHQRGGGESPEKKTSDHSSDRQNVEREEQTDETAEPTVMGGQLRQEDKDQKAAEEEAALERGMADLEASIQQMLEPQVEVEDQFVESPLEGVDEEDDGDSDDGQVGLAPMVQQNVHLNTFSAGTASRLGVLRPMRRTVPVALTIALLSCLERSARRRLPSSARLTTSAYPSANRSM